jgi:hypothetical protein
MLLTTKTRDVFLQKWLEYMESSSFVMEKAEICIKMYEETFNSPVKTNRPEYKDRLVKVLQNVMDTARKYEM